MQHPEAAEAMAIFRKWYASSALLLLSLRLKPARPEWSLLIKEILEAVGGMVNSLSPSSLHPLALPAPLASLIPHNPGNHCYLHAAVYLLAYICAIQLPPGPLRGANALEQALSSLWRESSQPDPSAGLVLSALPEWRSLLNECRHLHRQQDCMELILHLLERHPIAFLTYIRFCTLAK